MLSISENLKRVIKGYYDRIYLIEEQKWDLELDVRKRDYEVSGRSRSKCCKIRDIPGGPR